MIRQWWTPNVKNELSTNDEQLKELLHELVVSIILEWSTLEVGFILLFLYSSDLEDIGLSRDDVLSKYGGPSSIGEPSMNLLHELILRFGAINHVLFICLWEF